MAIKKPTSTEPVLETTETAPTSTSTAMALFGSQNLFAVEEPKEQTDLFLQAKIPAPVEMGTKFPATAINHLILYDGKAPQIVPAPYIMTVIAARPCSREEVSEDPGNPKSKKSYRRAYAGAATNQMHMDFVEKAKAKVPGFFSGNTYIVAIISSLGTTIAELAAFKTQTDYWGRPLYQARVQQGAGIQVLITDHTPNTTVSKTSGHGYLDPKKFTQIKPVELTQDQLEAISAVFTTQKAKFEAWLKQ